MSAKSMFGLLKSHGRRVTLVTERGSISADPSKKTHLTHQLYRTGDRDAPSIIKDRNGHVVLELCRRCGRAEIELAEPCKAPEGERGKR